MRPVAEPAPAATTSTATSATSALRVRGAAPFVVAEKGTRMTTIVYLGDGKALPVADPGMTILDVSIANKIPHFANAGAMGAARPVVSASVTGSRTSCRARSAKPRWPTRFAGTVHAPGVSDVA